MAMYIITGKLGGGKSLAALSIMDKYLSVGKRVATNIDVFPEFMLNYKNMASITRVPDKPRIEDLQMLGFGDNGTMEEYNEKTFGALVLDELGGVFNSRDSRNKERAALLNWFTNPRKMHWDVYLIIHNISMLDMQLRGILAEHVVSCKRMDRLTVPGLSFVTKLLTGRTLNMPRIHLAIVKYGQSENDTIVDRWWFRGKQYYSAYHTGQVFSDDVMYTDDGEAIDMRASYSILPPWLVYGRYLPKPKPFLYRLINSIYKFVVRVGRERSGSTAPARTNLSISNSELVLTISNGEEPLRFETPMLLKYQSI